MQDQNIFQLGEKLLLVTIERQTILINGQIAGFVEVLFDREKNQSEARIWLYPQYRSLISPVRKWVENSLGPQLILDVNPAGADIARYMEPNETTSPMDDIGWSVGFRADKRYGYEVYLTDLLTGFLYPVHTSKSRRNAFSIKRQIEEDLLILSEDAFAEKWGLQRIQVKAR